MSQVLMKLSFGPHDVNISKGVTPKIREKYTSHKFPKTKHFVTL